MNNEISATDLEQQIFKLEEIRVVIRCNKSTIFNKYNYIRKAHEDMYIADWYYNRLKPILGPDIDADIINGYGIIPHGRTKIKNIRVSYIKE